MTRFAAARCPDSGPRPARSVRALNLITRIAYNAPKAARHVKGHPHAAGRPLTPEGRTRVWRRN
ncbi:MAG: hypothetical protein Kow0067_18490 [Coriobacteriia bacterium]